MKRIGIDIALFMAMVITPLFILYHFGIYKPQDHSYLFLLISLNTIFVISYLLFRGKPTHKALKYYVPSQSNKHSIENNHQFEKKYKQLFSSVSDAIIIFDSQTQLIIEANSAALSLYDYNVETIYKCRFSDLSVKHLTNNDIDIIIKNNKTTNLPVFEHKNSAGNLFFVEISFGTFITNNQNFICATIRNITERKTYEKEIKQARNSAIKAYNVKSQFLANMSHEIRTPMNGLLGTLELISDTPLNENQKEYLTTALECGNNLMDILDDLLCFTKSESGKLTFEAIPFNIIELVNNSISQHTSTSNANNSKLKIEITGNLPPIVIGDPTRVRQIINNLLSNAIKFTNNGLITVNLSSRITPTSHQHIHIEIVDSGIGIKKNKLGKIFDSFAQADASTTRHYGGTGLGLAICKQLVTRMGGNIGAISNEKGGSIFWIDICFSIHDKVLHEENKSEPSSATLENRNIKILVAEDNLVNQKVLGAMLRKLQCSVTIVSDGHAAAVAAKDNQYDLILMDCQMPVMDGYEATEVIRNIDGSNKNIPIIAVTANAMPGDDNKCIAAGMNDYIAKPIKMDILLAKLNTWAPARCCAAEAPATTSEQISAHHSQVNRNEHIQ